MPSEAVARTAPTTSIRPVADGVARLGNVPGRHQQDGHTDGHVDEEDPPPRCRGDEVAAEERTGRGGHPAQPGPCADGLAPVVGGEGGLQNGQAPGGEEGAPDALEERVTISWPDPVETAQAAEARANQATPIMKTRLRPKRSPSEPPRSSSEARVRV